VAQARSHWSKIKAQGLGVSYWQQGAERGWEKKA
jgi:DNA polymerase IIIc chi subunit